MYIYSVSSSFLNFPYFIKIFSEYNCLAGRTSPTVSHFPGFRYCHWLKVSFLMSCHVYLFFNVKFTSILAVKRSIGTFKLKAGIASPDTERYADTKAGERCILSSIIRLGSVA